jgi:uncharacterized iron-regulated membrane protein
MKSLFLPSADSPMLQWVAFIFFLLLVCAALGGLIVWLKVARLGKPKRKRRARHHRRNNPTLAQTGGLPPKRDPNQPPPGP